MKRSLLCAISLCLSFGAVVHAANYSVIYSGGYDKNNNHDRYYDNTLRIWNTYTGTLGYDVDKVFVLFADGTDPGIDRSSGISSDWSMITAAGGNIADATKNSLQNTAQLLLNTMTSDDCLHFWSFDHGYGDSSTPDTGGIVTWASPYLSDDEFASWFNPIEANAKSYAFGQCYAGDMVNELDASHCNYLFSGWAADWYEYSWGDGWVDAWADGIDSGLCYTHELGEYALQNDIYGPSGTGQEHPGYAGDNFHMITNLPPVPAPAALLLGLVGVALSRRCRFDRA